MSLRTSSRHLVESMTAGLAVPPLAKAGAAVMAIGLAFDLAAHTLLHAAPDDLIGAFPAGEHLAHLVVVVGMLLVLAGIAADGFHQQRRLARQKGTARNAIR